MLHTLLVDVRYGTRMLVKQPLFAVVAIITLALGIGVNTAIFSVVNAVLLAPLPFERFDELLVIWKTTLPNRADQQPESALNLNDFKAQNKVFEQVAASRTQPFILTEGDEPERVIGARVSANLFSTLKVRPLLGRDFLDGEDQPGALPVVLISHRLWQQRYGGDPNLVGRLLTIDGKKFSLVGVLPPEVNYPTPETNIYIPLIYQQSEMLRGGRFLRLIGRLHPGISLAAAQVDIDAVGARLAQEYNVENNNTGYNLVPLREEIVGKVRPVLLVMLAAVICVLLIACVNVANLLLARAAARRSEFAIRAAIGATRSQLVRQMLVESLLLSLIGGTLGLLLAIGGLHYLVSISGDSLPRASEVGISLPVLGFTALISLLTGLFFGFAPAFWSSGSKSLEALKEGRRGLTGSVLHRRVLSILVVSEVAIALVLLIAAGLMIRTFISLNNVNPGFNPKGVIAIGVGLPSATYPDLPSQARFYDRALTEIRTLPAVQSASGVIRLPLLGFNASTSFTIQGKPVRPGDAPTTDYRAATQDYFKTMGIPFLKGRDFTDREMKEAPDVVIINKTMAERFFSDQDPIGKRIQIFPDPERWREIIGVVGDIKLLGLDADTNPAIYVPMSQNPYPNALRNVFFVARTGSDPKSIVADIRAKLRFVDKGIPISQVQTVEEVVSNSISQRRLSMTLLIIFAALAALLAAVGIYGVMAYIVAQRTHELGIRMAMGAQKRDVFSLVLGAGFKLTVIGAVIGLMAAFALTRFMGSLLFGVSASDLTTFVTIPLFLGAVALLASYVPARRAAKVNPIIALREG